MRILASTRFTRRPLGQCASGSSGKEEPSADVRRRPPPTVRILPRVRRGAEVAAFLVLCFDCSASACGVPSPLSCATLPLAMLEGLAAARLAAKRRLPDAALMALSVLHSCSPVTETNDSLRIAVDVLVMALPLALAYLRRRG